MSKVLMILKGSKILSQTWKQELQILDDGVYGETLIVGRRVKMHLAYENIAQVNIFRRVLIADIEIINKGGRDNLVIRAVNKAEAEKAKELIQQKIAEIKSMKTNATGTGLADEIKKLADLRDQKILTDEEFNEKKKQLLGLSK